MEVHSLWLKILKIKVKTKENKIKIKVKKAIKIKTTQVKIADKFLKKPSTHSAWVSIFPNTFLKIDLYSFFHF
jgi:hypothetical protein